MSIDGIISGLNRNRRTWPTDWVCLTGGEPFLQDIGSLVERLHKNGFQIQIETNGTSYRDYQLDWVTVSPKPPRYEVRPEFLVQAREVKLVVSKELSFPVLRRVRSNFPAGIPIFLQPESNRMKSRAKAMRLLLRALTEGFPDVRLGVQLHKVYNLR
jgi:organic radical activating enzyme